jgi:hypothetical protein
VARYVMANRIAGKFGEAELVASRAALASAADQIRTMKVIVDRRPDNPVARRVIVFEAAPTEVTAKREELGPDTLIEPEILHYPVTASPFHTTPIDLIPPWRMSSASPGQPVAPLRLTVTGGGAPLSDALVTLYFRGIGGRQLVSRRVTDARGEASFDLDRGFYAAAAVIAPNGHFWTMVARGPKDGERIECTPLPRSGPGAWWHGRMGAWAWM